MDGTMERTSGAGYGRALLIGLALATLLVFLAAAAYQAACALSVIEPGELPGRGPAGRDLAAIATLLALLAGVFLAPAVASSSSVGKVLAASLPPAGAAAVTARLYTFDPYYNPRATRPPRCESPHETAARH